MAEYHICRLNGAGTIVSDSYANCATDTEAQGLAMRLAAPDGQAEIWIGTRYVGKVSAMPNGIVLPPSLPGGHDPLGERFSARYVP